MSAERDLYAALSGASAVTDLIGSRIYPDARPEDDPLPAVVYQRRGTNPYPTIHGSVPAQEVSLEVWCGDVARPETEALADAVHSAATAAGFILNNRSSGFDPDTQTLFSTLAYTYGETS